MLHQKTGSSRNLIIYFPDLNIQVLLLHLFPRFIKMLLMVEIILPITATAKFSLLLRDDDLSSCDAVRNR